MSATNQSSPSRTVPSWAYLTALAAIGLISRLPQLFSPDLLLDGDECILGLMAKHLAEGREFPIFFYGQRYGLAVIEAPMAALSFVLLGIGAVPLKLAMLALWLVGIGFYFLAFSRLLGCRRSFWIALVLVLMPAWAVSAMKAWSGYLTAFTLAGALFYVLMKTDAQRPIRYVIAGALTSLIYLSQPSWLPGLAPVVACVLWSPRKRSPWLAYAAGFAAATAVTALIRTVLLIGSAESWTRPAVGNPELLRSIPRLLEQLYLNLTGSYFLRGGVEPGPITTAVASFWCAVLVAAVALQIYRLATRTYLLWSHLLFAGVTATLLTNWVLLDARDVRYLLSINVLIVFLAGVEVCDLIDRQRLSMPRLVPTVLLVLILQAVSMVEFAHFSYMWWTNSPDSPSEGQTLETVIDTMRLNGATCAFSMNALLQWQIMFYSRESVIARWTANVDRYPRYVTEVDHALANGERVAIVGYVGYSGGLEALVPNPQGISNVDGKYFVYVGATRPVLERAGFRLTQ
jgi:hypothetical protein